MIRRLSLAAAALLIAAPAAHAAADCYIGLHAGKSLTAAEVAEDLPGPVSLTFEGFQIGTRAGCDTSIPLSQIVIGGWVGYDLPDIESAVEDGYASAGVRAGFKLNDSALAYGLLGIAAPDFKFDDRGTLYGAGLEIDFSNVSPGLVGFVEFSRIDWRDTGTDASTDTIMVGAKIKLNVLK
jgi:hypothetical protein